MAADEERVAGFGQTCGRPEVAPVRAGSMALQGSSSRGSGLLHQGSGQQRPLLLTTGKADQTTAGQLVQSNLLQNSI